MRKKQLVGIVLIFGLMVGLFPYSVFAIFSGSTGSQNPYFEETPPTQPIWDPYILKINNTFYAIRVPLFWFNVSGTGDCYIGNENKSISFKMNLLGYAYVKSQDQWIQGTIDTRQVILYDNVSIHLIMNYTTGDQLIIGLYPSNLSRIKILTTVNKYSSFDLWERFAVGLKLWDLPERTKVVAHLWQWGKWAFNFEDYAPYDTLVEYNPEYNNASLFVSYRMNETLDERQWTIDPVYSYSTGTTTPTIAPFEDYDWYESQSVDDETKPSWMSYTTTDRTVGALTGRWGYYVRIQIPNTGYYDVLHRGCIVKAYAVGAAGTVTVDKILYLDTSFNTMYEKSVSVASGNLNDGESVELTITHDGWSGKADWIELQATFTGQAGFGYTAVNSYGDTYYNAAWLASNDFYFRIIYVDAYGWQDSFAAIAEWSGDITTDNDIATLSGSAEITISIDTATYEFMEISITEITDSATIIVNDGANNTAFDTLTETGLHRVNLKELTTSGTITTVYLDNTFKIDYIRIYKFVDYGYSYPTNMDKDCYAQDEGTDYLELGVEFDEAGDENFNIRQNIDDIETNDYPYFVVNCYVSDSNTKCWVRIIYNDSSTDWYGMTATSWTRYTFELDANKQVDWICLYVDDATSAIASGWHYAYFEFITFSCQSIDITGITVNLEDTYASPDQTIDITGITGEWGDGTSISAYNLQWFDLKENSTWIETNQTSTSTTVSLYTGNYEVGVGHCNDSRYRYFTGGTNYTFWVVGTQITGDFYYDVARIADVNYVITFYQTGQLTWLNGSVITTQPSVYSYLNTTENGYDTLLSTGWFDNKIYPVSVTSAQGAYETTFAFNLTVGDFWEEFYSEDITPIDMVESHLIFSFYSSYDGFGLANELLKIYVDDTRVYHNEHWAAGNTINLTITDYFDNSVEWSATGMVYPDYEFTAADIVFIDLGLAFYPLQFFNPGDHDLIVELSCSSITKNITVPPKAFSYPYRTIATTFTYRLFYMVESQGETTVYEWQSDESYSITVSSESYNFELHGIHDPEPTYGGGGGGTPFWFVVFVILGVFAAALGVGFVMRTGRKEQAPLVPPEPRYYEPQVKEKKARTQEQAFKKYVRKSSKAIQKGKDHLKNKNRRK